MGKKADEPDYQKQFEAAVRVIQGLPKNGSYRPSYEEMLRFYSYYKQATVGPCQISRPGFWDPIGRYKWDAWNRLGKMTKEEAMAAYIAEMKKAAQKVINTVPLDETSEDMFVYFQPLYDVIHDMPRPPESFFKKKTGPDYKDNAIKSNQATSESENEVFCDSLQQVEPDQAQRLSAKPCLPLSDPYEAQGPEKNEQKPPVHKSLSTREGELNKAAGPGDQSPPGHCADLEMAPHEEAVASSPEAICESPTGALIQQDVDLQVTSTIQALQQDVKKVMERLSYLESWAALQGHPAMLNPHPASVSKDEKEPPSWPVHLSPLTWLFLLAWPFVVQLLLRCFQRQKR
ncbi:hypothetical protein JRQ81_004907 [Phrynocephalus forsythii]|uniref:ACB domain-containing protein n=1 Tax=Phrynocephalus forsythii TaxID=171643 RepID=A0A9Q0XG36_9SAUR|nr:hypothetical protein JRQ81_004907 [Phrynocephalus forsythii]